MGKRKLIKLGTRFGRLVVVERAEDLETSRQKNTAYNCQCDCGGETVALAAELRSGRRTACGCVVGTTRKLIEIGTRFGHLVVIEQAEDIKGHTSYKCKCDCGNVSVIRAYALRYGQKACKRCTRLPEGEAGFNLLLSSYRNGAKKRGHVFELTKDEFRKLVTSNCAYCGVPPNAVRKSHSERGNFTYNGIDRMDNELGYTSDNITTCCWQCNTAKSARDYDEWIAWLDRIAEWRRK